MGEKCEIKVIFAITASSHSFSVVTRNDLCIKPHSKLPMQIKLTTHPHKLANLFKLPCTCEINSTAKIETMHYKVIPQTVLYNTNMKLQSNHHTMVISTVF